jgi:hypothetical protein
MALIRRIRPTNGSFAFHSLGMLEPVEHQGARILFQEKYQAKSGTLCETGFCVCVYNKPDRTASRINIIVYKRTFNLGGCPRH